MPWLYTSEITVDSANALSVALMFSWAVVLASTFEYMIFGPLGPHGTFFIFSGICFIGFLWIWLFLKETRGLNSLQKKTLYTRTTSLSKSESSDSLEEVVSPVKEKIML